MTDHIPFPTVMRGYDPEAVEQCVADLSSSLRNEQQRSADLSRQLSELGQAPEREPEATPQSFEQLGRVADQMLALVSAEADQIRSAAVDKAEAIVGSGEASAAKVRTEADRYAHDVRTAAEREAAQLVEAAKHHAAEVHDGAERHASMRAEEAEALFETHHAKAARAATDLEHTLSVRRHEAEKDIQEQAALAQQQLEAVQLRVRQLEADARQITTDAERHAAELTAQSEQHAEKVVSEATARAERIRVEAETSLASAAERRDSINAQLQSVRQMLSTITPDAEAAAG